MEQSVKNSVLFRLIIFFFIIHSFSHLNAQGKDKQVLLDSVFSLRQKAQNNKLPYEDRISFALEAQKLSQQIGEDSTLIKSNSVLSNIYLDMDDNQPFGLINKDNLKLSQKLNDSTIWAYSHHNLGYYYYTQFNYDSSYYHYFNAAKLYRALRDIKNEGEVLLNMADIQESEKDYIGSENNAIRAISLIETLPQNENNLETLWSLYNLLGVTTFRLGQYEDALRYHEQALEFSDKMKQKYVYNIFSRNNIALAYRELKNYDKAIEAYQKLLDDENLITNFPEAYASYLNNLAYTKFLSKNYDDNTIEQQFKKAYETCDTLNEPNRMMFICNNIAEYYMSKQQLDTAFYYANQAYNYGRDIQSYEEVLVSLKFMSEIKGGEAGRAYLNEHIQLNDSLLQVERSIRNKFARIEFETDQIKAENVQISRERLIFLLSSVGLLVTLILLYIIISQRAKNKELAFSQKQQEANEEIYNLMLAQQDKIDEGRTKEKQRISEELHDGILGRLFGTRLSLDSLNLQQTEEAVKTRGQYIEELKSIEQEIRKISHDLNADFVSGSSFTDIIKTLIENQTQAYQLTYEYHEDDAIDWDALSNKTKIHVYRMLQETMQNIYKHANAKFIKISFQLKNNVILLSVEDDGDGFNTGKAKKGIGLKNFDSRANDIGGKVEIFSKIGHGTRVKIHVPT